MRPKPKLPVPHAFVLEELYPLHPITRNMFGCTAIYIGEKIMLALRDKPTAANDNGLWLATTHDHHESLRREFRNMRSIEVLGKAATGWQLLPLDAADFEQAALHACALIARGDPRIGKVPKPRRSSPPVR
jgi:hypothetical protein